jgi:bacteriorhodopsin
MVDLPFPFMLWLLRRRAWMRSRVDLWVLPNDLVMNRCGLGSVATKSAAKWSLYNAIMYKALLVVVRGYGWAL